MQGRVGTNLSSWENTSRFEHFPCHNLKVFPQPGISNFLDHHSLYRKDHLLLRSPKYPAKFTCFYFAAKWKSKCDSK